MTVETITHQQIIELIQTLPKERLQSLYDFTVFLKQQSNGLTPEIDLFREGAEEIEADEKRWQEQFASSRESLRVMAREAKEEYKAGRTSPMEFGSDGRIVR